MGETCSHQMAIVAMWQTEFCQILAETLHEAVSDMKWDASWPKGF